MCRYAGVDCRCNVLVAAIVCYTLHVVSSIIVVLKVCVSEFSGRNYESCRKLCVQNITRTTCWSTFFPIAPAFLSAYSVQSTVKSGIV